MNKHLILILCLWVPTVYANEFSVGEPQINQRAVYLQSSSSRPDHVAANKTKKSVVVVDSNDYDHRICYYQDQAYTLGAILVIDESQNGKVMIECSAQHSFETNGALQWNRIESKK